MTKRLQQAVNKFTFCYNVTADTRSFFKLLANTKKSKRKISLKNDKEKPVHNNNG